MVSGVNTTCMEKMFSVLYSFETASFLAIFEYSDEHGKGRQVLFCVTVLATVRPWSLAPASGGCVQAGVLTSSCPTSVLEDLERQKES